MKTTTTTNFDRLSAEELTKLANENEFIAKYKALPKDMRSKLTQKQLLRMSKEYTMADTIQV